MDKFRRSVLVTAAATAMAFSAGLAQAAPTVKIAVLQELSGAGATSGTNAKNGAMLAIKQINAAGGILGRMIEATVSDTQSNPGVAKGMAQKAVDDDVFALVGPTYTGSIMVSMAETRRAQIPNFTGGEGASITQQGNPYIFRTSFTQADAMPRVVRFMVDDLKVKSVAVIYVNNDFGVGGREYFDKDAAASGLKVLADISTESGQIDFTAPVLKAKQSGADAIFVYTNEEESARALRELRKQGVTKPIVGETTLASQKVIELAGAAANGIYCHVGLSVDAPVPLLKKFNTEFQNEYHYITDHNGIKGYTAIYMLKAAIEKVGKFDRVAVAKALHGITISAAKNPGVLMDVHIDDNGDIDRESFIVQVENGKQVFKKILPALGKH